MFTQISQRLIHRLLIAAAVVGLGFGLVATFVGRNALAQLIWAAGTLPVVATLLVSMARDLLAGRLGVDAVAFVSMSAALGLGEGLAGAVVAVMYAGGNALEDIAVARAERDLKSWSTGRHDWRIGSAKAQSRTFQSGRSWSAMPSSCAAGRWCPSTAWSAAPMP